MSGGVKYGDIALGVESALPSFTRPASRLDRARHYFTWLMAALRRWA